MAVAVVDKNGIPLMPTKNYKARKLLKSGRAVIAKYRPVFTIRLLDREGGEVQPVEYTCDTGYQHIGISVCSEKYEYLNRQCDTLKDETERHKLCREYRRTRRNRKRYRQKRFDNRRRMICKDGFTPSIRHRRDLHAEQFQRIAEVIPVTSAVFEMGQFDTQVLKAVASGKPLPEGTDYQHGEEYGYATLREAVFARDEYRCAVCGQSAIKDGAILRMHHLGYRKGDRTNRMNNLITVCTKCHTAKNHAPGGKLYDFEPKLKPFKGATFMTAIRFDMYRRLKELRPDIEFRMTYGAATKEARKELNVKKTHSNDAYCMGEYHPKHRTDFEHYEKCRRNNRILEKFYDAKYIDTRDGSKKSGKQLSCGRTNRKEPRMSDKNERIYRGTKISKGRRSVRTKHYMIRPGDIARYNGKRYVVKGVQNNGAYVALTGHTPVRTDSIHGIKYTGAWKCI